MRPWRREERSEEDTGQADRDMGRRTGKLNKPCVPCAALHTCAKFMFSSHHKRTMCQPALPVLLDWFVSLLQGVLGEGLWKAGDVMCLDLGAVYTDI